MNGWLAAVSVPALSEAMRSVADFVSFVSSVDTAPGLFNPWSDHHPDLDLADGAERRRRNLATYLAQRRRPALALVGEAAGYQGARFSGMAFTSERLILSGRLGPGFVPSSRRSTDGKGWSEPSASIVWGALGDASSEVVLWNIVPFHPHRPAEPLTNRTPTRAEVKSGLAVLERFLEVIQPRRVLAVGRVSQEATGFEYVRHPARGGANRFRAAVSAAVSSL